MKKAIIDPRQSVSYVTGYDTQGNAIIAVLPNSARVAEVTDAEFPVAAPLFWVDCVDDVVADQWYYDMVTQVCLVVPLPPTPANQPVASGAQPL
jgi:hypothetical protein